MFRQTVGGGAAYAELLAPTLTMAANREGVNGGMARPSGLKAAPGSRAARRAENQFTVSVDRIEKSA